MEEASSSGGSNGSQVDRNAFGPQVIHPQDTADDVSPEIVKHQNLPDGLSIFPE